VQDRPIDAALDELDRRIRLLVPRVAVVASGPAQLVPATRLRLSISTTSRHRP
jgi:hypothetical protein